MTAQKVVALFLQRYPALPPETAPVYLLLCGHGFLTTAGVARHLGLAQSTAARSLALLVQSGLAEEADSAGKRTRRWTLTETGSALARTISAET